MKTITVRVKGARVEIEAHGYAGAECLAATRALETAIGGFNVVEDTSKAEMFATVEEEVQS